MFAKLDFIKQYSQFYLPNTTPELITIPAMQYIMVDGTGTSKEEYQDTLDILYSLSYSIKMCKLADWRPKDYQEYVIPPLEGFWNCQSDCLIPDQGAWLRTLAIRQPDFITEEIFNRTCSILKKKKPKLATYKAAFKAIHEGQCVQLLHVGSHTSKNCSIEKMNTFIANKNLTISYTKSSYYHEIYLNDPRKTEPGQLKTVLRFPVLKLNDDLE